MTSPAARPKTRRVFVLVGVLVAALIALAVVLLGSGGGEPASTSAPAASDARVTISEMTVGGNSTFVTHEQMLCAIEHYNVNSGDTITDIPGITSNLITVRQSDVAACK